MESNDEKVSNDGCESTSEKKPMDTKQVPDECKEIERSTLSTIVEHKPSENTNLEPSASREVSKESTSPKDKHNVENLNSTSEANESSDSPDATQNDLNMNSQDSKCISLPSGTEVDKHNGEMLNQTSEKDNFEEAGGISQATTIEMDEMNRDQCSQDLFDTQPDDTIPTTPKLLSSTIEKDTMIKSIAENYEDFIKTDGSSHLLPSSTRVHDLIPKDIASTPKKRKLDQSLVDPSPIKLQRIAEEETVQDVSVPGKSQASSSHGESSGERVADSMKHSPQRSSYVQIDVDGSELEIVSPKKDQSNNGLIPPSQDVIRKINFGSDPDSVGGKISGKRRISDCETEEHVEVTGESLRSEQPKVKKSRPSIEILSVKCPSKTSNLSGKPLSTVQEVVNVDESLDDSASDQDYHLLIDDDLDDSKKELNAKSAGTPTKIDSVGSSQNDGNSKLKSSDETPDMKNPHKGVMEDEPETLNLCSDEDEPSPQDKMDLIHPASQKCKSPSEAPKVGDDCSTKNDNSEMEKCIPRGKKNLKFSFPKCDIATPEDSPQITSSCLLFSEVKNVANLQTSASSSISRLNKNVLLQRKDKEGSDVIHTLESDGESDAQSTPPSTLAQKGLALISDKITPNLMMTSSHVKGQHHSTPHEGSMPTPNDSASTIGTDSVKETIFTPTIEVEHNVPGQTIKIKGKICIIADLTLEYHEETKLVVSREILECEDKTEEFFHLPHPRRSDVSSGNLADVSKDPSPTSVTSGQGLFNLPLSRHSILSVTSSSSSSSVESSASSLAIKGLRKKLMTGPFPVPLPPKVNKDRTFFPHTASHHSQVKNIELFEQVVLRIHPDTLLQTQVTDNKGSGNISNASLKDLKNITQRNNGKGSNLPFAPTPEESEMEPKNDLTEEVETPKSKKKYSGRHMRARRTRESKDDTDLLPDLSRSKTRSVGLGTPLKEHKAIATPSTSSGDNKPLEVKRTPTRISSRVGSKLASSSQSKTPTRSSKEVDDNKVKEISPVAKRSLANKGSELDQFSPGDAIFAKWVDKHYYSAQIKEKAKDDRWIVIFDDGNVKTLVEDFLIPVNILQKGQLVCAIEDEDEEDYESGVIVKFQVHHNVVKYGVELDSGKIVFVPCSKIRMTEDQAKLLKEKMPSSPQPTTPKQLTTFSLENVIGNRSRSARKTLQYPSKSNVEKVEPNTSFSQDTSYSSDVGSTAKETLPDCEFISGIDAENFPRLDPVFSNKVSAKLLGKVKGRARATPRKVTLSKEEQEVISTYGPIPPKDSKIFTGKNFILTCDISKRIEANSCATLSDGGKSSDDEECLFDKEYLTKQLIAGGANVYERFQDIPQDQYSSTYLISNKAVLTAKYIQCLAHGIPAISYKWVANIAKGGKESINGVKLPAGRSLETDSYIEQGESSKRKKLLDGMSIILAWNSKESSHSVNFWEEILVATGAQVQRFTKKDEICFWKASIIVSLDTTCPMDLELHAQSEDLPIVSTTWLVQSIIRRKLVPFQAHPKYSYSYIN